MTMDKNLDIVMASEQKYYTIKEYLNHLIAGRETSCVEFKYGKGGFPHKEFWPTYSSFANTDGGVIIIGVKEKNGNFYPEGLSAETVEQYEKIFWDSINDPNQVSRKLLTNKDVIKDDYNGNYFLIFFVPRASREERPVYVGQNPMRSTYRRNASGDYLCKEWEVAIMLAEQRPKLAMDAEILEGYTIDDIDKESLRGFRQLFMNLKPTHPWTEDDDLTLLKHMKAYGKDRISGKAGLTLAGLLMFGKYDAITDAMPQFMIDYREYTPGSERWSDRIVFSNPGTMLVSKEQYFSGGESICRNPALQTMFSMIGAVEKAGSGADTIVKGWDDAKFGTPVISEKSEPNKVELTLPIISDGDSNTESNGTSKGGSKGGSKGREKVSYPDLCKIIIEICEDWKTTQEIAKTINYKHKYLGSKIIPRMIADGLLEPYDKESPKSPEQKYRAVSK